MIVMHGRCQNGLMAETIHRLDDSEWAPRVVRQDDWLWVRLPVYDHHGWHVHEHSFPIAPEHLDALRSDTSRQLLVWCALEQLCQQAGRRVKDAASIKVGLVPKPDQTAARRALDVVLLQSHADVEQYFAREGFSTRRLISHGAAPELLATGRLFAALGDSPSATANWRLIEQDEERRRGQTTRTRDEGRRGP